jgi:putative transposase
MISIRRQCDLLGVARSRYYYNSKEETAENLEMMRRIDELLLRDPTMGARKLAKQLSREQGRRINRKRVSRLMAMMGACAVYPRKRTTIPKKGDYIYPYLLKGLDINRPNQVWCTDITYIPMARGFMYLSVVMDWYSRRVLSWKVSNSMDASLCMDTVKEAIRQTGVTPEIMNSDQGCQYTSEEWGRLMKQHGIRISMDGKGRWIDNVVIERFWWSLKYEDIYLHAYRDGPRLRQGLKAYMHRYNYERLHQTLDYMTPDEVYKKDERRAA